MKRPCLVCGAPSDGSRCERHATGGWSAWRPMRPANSYGSAWRTLRAVVLAEEPRCRLCGAPASEVDHILNRAAGGSDNRSNLRSICQRCHRSKTSAEGGRAARQARRVGGYPEREARSHGAPALLRSRGARESGGS